MLIITDNKKRGRRLASQRVRPFGELPKFAGPSERLPGVRAQLRRHSVATARTPRRPASCQSSPERARRRPRDHNAPPDAPTPDTRPRVVCFLSRVIRESDWLLRPVVESEDRVL
nr:unnamed protein product [Callosobruchus analis]